MKEPILRFLHYNVWANARFIAVLRTLGDERLDMEMKSSFPTIRATVAHMWGAEDIWLQRLEQLEKPVWRAHDYKGSIAEACAIWEGVSQGLAAFAMALPEERLAQRIEVVTMAGARNNDRINDILLHVVNHASYHRGQLVTMLRQAGVADIPSTDFYAYTRQGGS
jgi:uncharacterized damage-inducible protein DinB